MITKLDKDCIYFIKVLNDHELNYMGKEFGGGNELIPFCLEVVRDSATDEIISIVDSYTPAFFDWEDEDNEEWLSDVCELYGNGKFFADKKEYDLKDTDNEVVLAMKNIGIDKRYNLKTLSKKLGSIEAIWESLKTELERNFGWQLYRKPFPTTTVQPEETETIIVGEETVVLLDDYHDLQEFRHVEYSGSAHCLFKDNSLKFYITKTRGFFADNKEMIMVFFKNNMALALYFDGKLFPKKEDLPESYYQLYSVMSLSLPSSLKSIMGEIWANLKKSLPVGYNGGMQEYYDFETLWVTLKNIYGV
ncbi:MAG: hypothetical protein WC175_06610 [Candidatus Dojkabacteria bacterium]